MYGSPRVRSPTTRFTCGLEQLSFFVFFCGIPQKGVNWQKKIGGAYTSDPPLFSGQARPRPHVLPAFTLRPENGPIIRLTVPAVNAGRQKTSAGTVSPPFRPAPDLTEAPLSDFAVSLRSLENAAYPSYPLFVDMHTGGTEQVAHTLKLTD